jgi:hypothetical protein
MIDFWTDLESARVALVSWFLAIGRIARTSPAEINVSKSTTRIRSSVFVHALSVRQRHAAGQAGRS